MQNNYLDKITKLLKRTHPKLETSHRLEFKNCFGAIAGYVNGHIFISCGKFGVALRLSPASLHRLFRQKDVKRLRYFPTGHIKKQYAVIPKRIAENKRRIKKLVDESLRYASSKK